MVLRNKILAVLFTVAFMATALGITANLALADDTTGTQAGFCDKVKSDPTLSQKYMPCGVNPSQCGTTGGKKPPPNCLFLEEPIGGQVGYDLYKIVCHADKTCDYILWQGEAVNTDAGEHGPVQALMQYTPGKEYQGPFGLLYSYVQLVYNFLSAIIVAFVVLIAIFGGITMTTAGGDSGKFDKGRDLIIKALIGMAIWFLASVILYTINPTFFTF